MRLARLAAVCPWWAVLRRLKSVSSVKGSGGFIVRRLANSKCPIASCVSDEGEDIRQETNIFELGLQYLETA